MSQRLRLHLVGGGIGMIEEKGEKGWKFFGGTQEFSPLAHQKLISPKWRENKGGKLVQLFYKTTPFFVTSFFLFSSVLVFFFICLSLASISVR